MHKYQEWVQNRAYERHLNSLNLIKSRPAITPKPQHIRAKSLLDTLPARTSRTNPIKPKTNPIDTYCNLNPSSRGKQRTHSNTHKLTITPSQKLLLQQNDQMAQRINNIPPVINKEYLDQQYTEHQSHVRRLTKSRSKTQSNRDKNFKKYQSNINTTPRSPSPRGKSLRIRIHNIVWISNKLEIRNECLYQLMIPSFKKQSQKLDYFNFTNEEMVFSLSRVPKVLRLVIIQIKGIESFLLGEFRVELDGFKGEGGKRKNKYIQMIKHRGRIQGTVELSVEIPPTSKPNPETK